MKTRILWGVFSLFCCAIGLAGCGDEENTGPVPGPDDVHDVYLSPSVSRGKTALVKERLLPVYLGVGYDVTGEYASNGSLRQKVVDLEKVGGDRVTSLSGMTAEHVSFQGKDYTQLLKSLMEEGKFVSPTGEKSHLLFAHTITRSHIAVTPYDYSSQYAFVLDLSGNRLVRQSLQTLNLNWDTCLSDEFKEALAYSSAREVVEMFGTHLLVRAYLGASVRTLYRSVVAADGEKAVLYAASRGMEACRSTVVASSHAPAEEAKKNYDESIAIAFQGGDYAALADVVVVPGGGILGDPIDITAWLYGVEETNCALAALHGEDLVPLYEVVSDPQKKRQIKEAVVEHIVASQPGRLATSAVFQATDGERYRYACSYKELEGRMDAAFAQNGVLGSVYKVRQEGMVPLYRLSDGQSDCLATARVLEDRPSMEYAESLGYVYESWEKGTETLYEVSSGEGFAYTPEKKEVYGEKGKWKRTGKEIHIMRGAR